MYTGFNFKTKNTFSGYYSDGTKLYNLMKTSIEEQLDKYIGENGELNGSNIQADWFPEINADIFLSHSHRDEDLAIKFAGYLYKEFNLITFIDSCIWGYSEDLLKKIDDKYCWNSKTETYSYETRNFSTSHIHMMLSTALMKMINKTECIIFFNTNNSSTTTKDLLTDKTTQRTKSPWIYSEIVAINLIKKSNLVPIEREKKFISKSINHSLYEQTEKKDLVINYDIDKELTNLYNLTDLTLSNWLKSCKQYDFKKTDALDKLYLLTIHNHNNTLDINYDFQLT